ncbi:MAG: TlpA disulfide reductase family protein [Gammaproteobacteria bacterium]|jgi:thiol-disulfide isomerase/thioredoxin
MSRHIQSIFKTLLYLLVLQALWVTPAHAMEQVTFSTKNGDMHLSDFNGQVVYVDFWASWCKPCRKSFPWMNNLQKRFANKGLKIIAVNVDKDKSLVEQFLKSYPANFIVAYDPEGQLASQFKVKGMPSTYIFDRYGNLKTSHIGFRNKDKNMLESIVESAISHKK